MKRNIILALAFILLLGSFLLAEEEATFTVKVAAANIRSKPNSTAPIIAKVTAGTVMKVYGKEGAWYEVGVTNPAGKEIYGFINSTLGEVKGLEAEEKAEPKAEAEAEAQEKPVVAASKEVVKARSELPAKAKRIVKVKVQMANVRSEPDAKSEVIARVAAGTQLGVFSEAGNWLEVAVNDKTGKEVSGFILDSVVAGIDDEEEAEEEEEEEEVAPRRTVRRSSAKRSAGTAMHFGINFGAQTDDSFTFDPFLWTVGAELDFHFGSYLMLSPEVTLVGSGFEFKEFILYPAVVLNFTAGPLFFGGGVAKGFLIGTYSGSGDFVLKLNAGLLAQNFKLTAYVLTAFDSLFENMVLGATLGFRF